MNQNLYSTAWPASRNMLVYNDVYTAYVHMQRAYIHTYIQTDRESVSQTDRQTYRC